MSCPASVHLGEVGYLIAIVSDYQRSTQAALLGDQNAPNIQTDVAPSY